MELVIDLVFAGMLALIVIGLFEVVKAGFNVPDRFKPLISLVISFVLVVIYQYVGGEPLMGLWLEAIVAGLIACGLYDQKAVFGGQK